MAIFGQNRRNNNKTMNRSWYRPAEKKDLNAMDVDALTFKERQMLIKQGKCFKCRKTGQPIAQEEKKTERGRRKKNLRKPTQ